MVRQHALFCLAAYYRDVDGCHDYGGSSVDNLDDGQPAVDAWIDSENSHRAPSSARSGAAVRNSLALP
jgi:hypothetical protein